jgi:hypothetical protein
MTLKKKMDNMTHCGHEKYIEELGYGDTNRPVFKEAVDEDGVEQDVPEYCNVLAKWPSGAFTAHFRVPNDVRGFFEALDEVGDPAAVSKMWCCDSDDEGYLDTDSDCSIDWPLK